MQGDLKTYIRSQLSNVEWLDNQGQLLNFGCDMAAGLQALHQNSFVHRFVFMASVYFACCCVMPSGLLLLILLH